MKLLLWILIILTSFSANATLPATSNSGDIIINTFNEYRYLTFDGIRLTERKKHTGRGGAWFPQASMSPLGENVINTQQLLPSLGLMPSLFKPKSGIESIGLKKHFLDDTRDGFTYFDFYKEKIILNSNLVFNDGKNSRAFPSIFQPDNMYSNIIIMDLSSLKVEKRLPIGTVKALQVVDDFLYTISPRGDVLRVDLKSYQIKKLNNEPIKWLWPTFIVTSEHKVYLATTQHKYDNTPTKLKPSHLYILEGGSVSEVAELPSEHLRNRVIESNGKLHFLLENSNLWSVDLSTGKSFSSELPFKAKKLNDAFFVKLSEDIFVFTERNDKGTRLFITNSSLKLLAEHDLEMPGGGMQWNLSTREQPYGNQKL